MPKSEEEVRFCQSGQRCLYGGKILPRQKISVVQTRLGEVHYHRFCYRHVVKDRGRKIEAKKTDVFRRLHRLSGDFEKPKKRWSWRYLCGKEEVLWGCQNIGSPGHPTISTISAGEGAVKNTAGKARASPAKNVFCAEARILTSTKRTDVCFTRSWKDSIPPRLFLFPRKKLKVLNFKLS